MHLHLPLFRHILWTGVHAFYTAKCRLDTFLLTPVSTAQTEGVQYWSLSSEGLGARQTWVSTLTL